MKTVGNLPSLVQGVSEHEPHNRAPGKMWESVNFIDSPTRGKSRRRGTRAVAHVALPGEVPSAHAEAKAMSEYTFIIEGREYSLLYRNAASANGAPYFAKLFSKTEGKFYNIVYENSTWVNTLISGGVSAVACVGRYVYIAGNNTIPRATSVDLWDAPTNRQKLSGWIREGAYSRKFTVTLYRADGTTLAVEYTTKAAAYPELLDTSDIPFYLPGTSPAEPDPEYQKKVNDRVNAYEGERTAWIRLAAEDIVPANIARKLAELLVDEGVAASAMGPCVLVDDPAFVDIRLTDDGSGGLVTAAGREVQDPTDVTLYHWHGKIVRVRPRTGGDRSAYYLRAVGLDGATGWTKVEWVEAAGVEHTVHNIVSQMVLDTSTGTAYVAQDAAGLTSLAPALGPHVDYAKNLVGDGINAPLPHFFGRRINALTLFQDRLVVTSGNMVNMSRSSDYLNFFRATVLNIVATDPIEVFAHGSEGDTIRRAVMYERDLVLFGELRQYAISGREFMGADAPNISTIGAYEGGASVQPIASGNFLFFSKHASNRTGLYQMEPGDTPETTVVFDVAQELDRWLSGSPVQLLGTTMPNMVSVRTDSSPSIWYLYKYEDTRGSGRTLSSWGKCAYSPALGTIAGISHYDGDHFIFTLRTAGGKDYWFADRLDFNSDLADHPHLDSYVPYGEETPWHLAASGLSAAATKASDYYLLGSDYDDVDDLIEQAPGIESALVVGAASPAYFQLTNPFLRDGAGLPLLNARLTLTSYLLHLADTGGLAAYVYKPDAQRTLLFEGRVLGHSSNLVGRQPIFSGTRQVSVGREVRDCIVEIRAQNWLPLRVTGAEWSGQSFMPRARGLY